jgi:hypothetical protein
MDIRRSTRIDLAELHRGIALNTVSELRRKPEFLPTSYIAVFIVFALATFTYTKNFFAPWNSFASVDKLAGARHTFHFALSPSSPECVPEYLAPSGPLIPTEYPLLPQ